MLNDKPCNPWQVLKKAYTSQCDIWSLGATQLRAHWDALRWFRSRCCFQDLQISIDFWESFGDLRLLDNYMYTCVYIYYTYYGIYTVLCRAAHAGRISFHLSESQVIAFVLLSGYMPFSGSEAVKISDPDLTEAVPWWHVVMTHGLPRISIGFPYFPKVQTRNISTGSALLKLLKRTHWRGERLTVQL